MVVFSHDCIVKRFDNNQYKVSKTKTKEFDGPNDFSLLWNQLLILWQNELITDSRSLKTKILPSILKKYSWNIQTEIDIILYKFIDLNMKYVTLYYDTYRIKNDLETINKLYGLKKVLMNL